MAAQIEIKVVSTTAMKTVFDELSPRFENATGNRLALNFGPSSQLEARLGGGETADVAILAAPGAKALAAEGKIVAGSLTDVALSSLGIAVQKGAPKPDVSSVDAFKRAILAARSVAVSKPVGGGQSGAHMAKVFAQLGIADAVNAKVKYGAGGPGGLVGLIIRSGEAEIGVQQFAELKGVSGIDIVGPMPAELQCITTFTAAIPANAHHAEAGRSLIGFLTNEAAKSVIKAKGLDPA